MKGPRSRQGANPRREAEIGSRMLGCLTSGWPLGLWAPVPARGPQAEKEREGKGKATGTPGAKERESQRGPKCNRRAFPICRGLVPGKGRPPERSRDWEPDAWLSLVWVAFGLVGPVPARGPQAKKERGKGKATGTPESQRAREAREAKSATDGLFLYVGASFPARGGPRREAEIGSRMLGCLTSGWPLGLWAPVPARGPQAEKEREGKGKATGTPGAKEPESQRGPKCNRRAFPICRGLVPGKGRPPERSRDWEPDAWLSLVWVAFGLVGPVPATGPEAKKERGKGKATGTPESQRGHRGQRGQKCNRRAFPICRGLVPGKGPPRREAEIGSRTLGCL